jgi:predicted enzyme related to lactoylglutathione lyase
MMRVQEMFFSVDVRDMDRAVAFYESAFGAAVDFWSPTWSSLVIAGIRVSLVLREHAAPSNGLHFIVDDIALACAVIACAGGQIKPAVEASGGSIMAEVIDTEGNTFTLRQRPGRTVTVAVPATEARSAPAARA